MQVRAPRTYIKDAREAAAEMNQCVQGPGLRSASPSSVCVCVRRACGSGMYYTRLPRDPKARRGGVPAE